MELERNYVEEILNDNEFLKQLKQKLNDSISVWGNEDRLHIDKTAKMTNTLFNTTSGEITIGKHVFTGHNVAIITGTHDISKKDEQRMESYPIIGRDIIIGDGVWIASNCVILGPCIIGNNAVIAAGAIVKPNTNIPPNTIWGGIPANKIKNIDLCMGGNGMLKDVNAKDVLDKIQHMEDEFLVNKNESLTNEIKDRINKTDWEEIQTENKGKTPQFKKQELKSADTMWSETYLKELNEYKDITQKIPEGTRLQLIKKIINKIMKVTTRYQEIFNNRVVGFTSVLAKKISTIENYNYNQNIILENIVERINDELEKTNSKIDNELEKTNSKIDNELEKTNSKIDNELEKTNSKIDNELEKTNSKIDNELEKTNSKIDNELEKTNSKIDNELEKTNSKIDNELEKTNSKIDNELEKTNSKLDEELEKTNSKLDEELEKTNSKLEYFIISSDERFNGDEDWSKLLSNRIDEIDGAIYRLRNELFAEIKHSINGSEVSQTKIYIEPKILSSYREYCNKNGDIKKVNIGCGNLTKENYINIDGRELEGVDIVADVRKLPFKENQLDEIYAAHLLEHFEDETLKNELLPYWYSLVKFNGKIRIIVPNIGEMVKQYSNGEIPFSQLKELVFGGQEYSGNYHYTMFNEDKLKTLLEETGFKNIKVVSSKRKNGLCTEMEIEATKV